MRFPARRNRLAAVAALAAAGLAILTGCSGGGGGSSTGTSSLTSLTLTAQTAPISLNPALSNSGLAELFVSLGYSSLIHATSDGEFVPALAESWQYLDEGNTDFEITLRKGLKFSDGTDLDSAAVKASLEYYRAAQGPFAATTNIIDSIETPDDVTVELKLNAPSPDLPFQFAEGGLWGAIISPAGIADPDSLGTATAGAGPYMLDPSRSVTNSTYVYSRNPDYYDQAAQKWDTVTINVVADANAALQTVTSGQSNWVAGTQDQVAAAQGAGLVVEQAVPTNVILMLQDRAGSLVPALGEEKVRQALNYAIDRDSIAEVLGGTANQEIIAANRDGYSDEAATLYSYDVDKAKQLLAEAGYADGFSMSVIVGAYDPLGTKALEIIAQDYAAIGVQVDITTAPTFADYARQQESGDFPATILPWGSTTMFTVAGQLVLPAGVVNPFHTDDEDLVGLFEKAAGQSASDATSTWEQLNLEVGQKGWFVPVATVPSQFFGNGGIHPAGDGFTYPNALFF